MAINYSLVPVDIFMCFHVISNQHGYKVLSQ